MQFFSGVYQTLALASGGGSFRWDRVLPVFAHERGARKNIRATWGGQSSAMHVGDRDFSLIDG
jgi:hypothetical protein